MAVLSDCRSDLSGAQASRFCQPSRLKLFGKVVKGGTVACHKAIHQFLAQRLTHITACAPKYHMDSEYFSALRPRRSLQPFRSTVFFAVACSKRTIHVHVPLGFRGALRICMRVRSHSVVSNPKRPSIYRVCFRCPFNPWMLQ